MILIEKFAVIGLGNPGLKYRANRHNIGFNAIDHLAKTWELPSFQKKKSIAEYSSINIKEKQILLIKPLTYMNDSGKALQWLLSYYKIQLDNILVIYDDVDLKTGVLRIRARGSAGTHNGMRSIVGCIGSNFPRLKIGIKPTHPVSNLANFVLSNFKDSELKIIRKQILKIPDIISEWLKNGLSQAMNKFNSYNSNNLP